MLEGSGISPFSQRGLDEAFGFAVGLRGVRLNPDVLDSELFAGAGEGFGEVAATIVSHDAFDGNAEAPEVGDGGDQERDGAFLLLVGEDISTRYPRMVVDSDVDEFPACTLTAAIACAASGDAVAHAAETAELLNVEMDDLAWFLALVAWMWLLQLEAREPAEAAAFENARDAGFGHAAIRNGTHHFLSTFRGQASILMGVHSVLRESLTFGNISVPGSDRMDNLPKVHS